MDGHDYTPTFTLVLLLRLTYSDSLSEYLFSVNSFSDVLHLSILSSSHSFLERTNSPSSFRTLRDTLDVSGRLASCPSVPLPSRCTPVVRVPGVRIIQTTKTGLSLLLSNILKIRLLCLSRTTKIFLERSESSWSNLCKVERVRGLKDIVIEIVQNVHQIIKEVNRRVEGPTGFPKKPFLTFSFTLTRLLPVTVSYIPRVYTLGPAVPSKTVDSLNVRELNETHISHFCVFSRL